MKIIQTNDKGALLVMGNTFLCLFLTCRTREVMVDDGSCPHKSVKTLKIKTDCNFQFKLELFFLLEDKFISVRVMLNTLQIEYSLECLRVITFKFYHLTPQQPPAQHIS